MNNAFMDKVANSAVVSATTGLRLSVKVRAKRAVMDILDGDGLENALKKNGITQKAFWLILARDAKAGSWFQNALKGRFLKAALRLTEIAEEYREGTLTDRAALVESQLISKLLPVVKATFQKDEGGNDENDGWDTMPAEDRIRLITGAKRIEMSGEPQKAIEGEETLSLAAPATERVETAVSD